MKISDNVSSNSNLIEPNSLSQDEAVNNGNNSVENLELALESGVEITSSIAEAQLNNIGSDLQRLKVNSVVDKHQNMSLQDAEKILADQNTSDTTHSPSLLIQRPGHRP